MSSRLVAKAVEHGEHIHVFLQLVHGGHSNDDSTCEWPILNEFAALMYLFAASCTTRVKQN
jgi:hypothetical protein